MPESSAHESAISASDLSKDPNEIGKDEQVPSSSNTNHPPKQLARRSLWSGIFDRVKNVISDKDEAPLIDQKTGEKLMTRREMIATTTIAASGTYIASRHLSTLLESLLDQRPETLPRDIDPTPEEIAAVEAILEKYKDKGINEPERNIEAAKKHNLTLYNDSNIGEAGKKIFDNFHNFRDYKNPQHYGDESQLLSFAEYFEAVRDILKEKYGIDLTLGDDTREYSYGGKPLKPEELETVQSRVSILNLLRSVFDQPVELIKITGLKKISLIKMTEAAGYAEINGSNDTYFADPTLEAEAGLFDHELYHLYDANKCGNQFGIDNGFNNLNPPGWQYTDNKLPKPEGYISDEEYRKFGWDLIMGQLKDFADLKNNPQKKQEIIDEKAHHVATPSEYGFTHIVEEKADLGKILFNPNNYASALDSRKPILRKKFIFLLARLYHDNPKLVEYFIEVSLKGKSGVTYDDFTLTV